MTKKKILFLDQGQIFGGAEKYMVDILRSLPKDKYAMTIIISKDADSDYKHALSEINGLTIMHAYIPVLKPFSLKTIIRALRSVLSLSVQIARLTPLRVQSNTVRTHIVGSLACMLTRTPCLWTMHDFSFDSFWLKRLRKIPKAFICVSLDVAEFVRTFLPEALWNQVHIIPNGVAPHELPSKNPAITVARKPFRFRKDKIYIGIVGRIDTWKGQHVFLEAAKIMAEEYPQHKKLQFLVIGGLTGTSKERRSYYQKLKNYIKTNSLEKSTVLMGHQEEIAFIMDKLDILVHASTDPEPFGRTIIEGFAAGVPVIASNIGTPAHMIQYGKNGLLHSPGDARDLAQKISIVLEDAGLRATLVHGAKRDVSDLYSLERVVDSIQEVWSSV